MKAFTETVRWIMICLFLSIPGAIAFADITPRANDTPTVSAPGRSDKGKILLARSNNPETSMEDMIADLILDRSEQGYIRLGGVQIAWGRENVQGMQSKAITFPASFSKTPAVTLGAEQSGGARFTMFIESATKTGFTLKTSSVNNRVSSWIAIGTWK